jgi:hypothetical protein
MNLLIHADPGARSGFVAAWLQNKLTSTAFDAGMVNSPSFLKIHRLTDVLKIKNFSGLKIRIRPTVEKLDLHTLLFLRKNVQVQDPTFTKDEYSLETFAKLWNFSKEIFQWDSELDYNLYDYVFNFESSFDIECMTTLYKQITQQEPSANQIQILEENNKLNSLMLDKNHCASLVKIIWSKEQELGLKEANRFWSVVNVFNDVPVDQRYKTIDQLITLDNYGIVLKDKNGIFR